MERLEKKEKKNHKIDLGLLSLKCGENILATKLTLWASHLWWHFHDKVTTFLGCCFEAFARSIVLRFWRYIIAIKLTLWASPLWWHFHDKVTTFLWYCFQAFDRSIALQFWREHSCNKVDTLSLSLILHMMTFPWHNFP